MTRMLERPAAAAAPPPVEVAAPEAVSRTADFALFEVLPSAPPAVPARPRPVGDRQPLGKLAARLIGVGTFVAFVVGIAVEPAPDGPEPVAPAWVDVLSIGTLVLLLASWIVLGRGRRSGLHLGVAAGLGLLTMTALCPTSGHHELSGWWYSQLAMGLVITGVPAVALAVTGRSRRSADSVSADPG